MTGPGLDRWSEPFPEAPTLRQLHPPRTVLVDVARALPGPGFARADHLPLRVRAGGIHLDATMPATLHAWLRGSDGRWLAQVRIPTHTANHHANLDLWLWVDSAALTPAPDRP